MKNKTLVVLLVVPFTVGLLTFTSVTIIRRTVAADILGISWDYSENEGLQIDTTEKLEATPIVDENLILADGNDLVWTVKNSDRSSEAHAEISINNGDYYLTGLNEGDVTVTCSNENGTVSRSFACVVYEDGAVVVNPKNAGTGTSITGVRSFGRYDLSYGDQSVTQDTAYTKVNAEIELGFAVYGDYSSTVVCETHSDNISYDSASSTVTVLGSGEASIVFAPEDERAITTTYTFTIIDEGVNVYSYDDLLLCTNYSSSGEVVVMQKSLGSFTDIYGSEDSSSWGDPLNSYTDLFGHYDGSSFSFEDEYYSFETTYPHDYIYQTASSEEEGLANSQVKAAVRVQKDFYGNGYSLNFHELAYPKNGVATNNVNTHGIYIPADGDLFQGPLTFYGIGVNEFMLVRAYGQDNVGLYIDGDNITVDDLTVSASNATDDLNLLRYCGSAIDVHGDNNTIQNCVVGYGRTGIRSFSSDDLLIDNCLIRKNAEFNLKLGSDEIAKPDEEGTVSFTSTAGEVNESFSDFYTLNNPEGDTDISANSLMSSYVDNDSSTTTSGHISNVQNVQSTLDNSSSYVSSSGSLTSYYGVTLRDSFLWSSGLFSIAMESCFNGPFLYNGTPAQYNSILSTLFNLVGVEMPSNLGGTSKPTNLTIQGDTRIYDWKTNLTELDMAVLIEENFTTFLEQVNLAQTMVDRLGHELTIDDFFPVKSMYIDEAMDEDYVYNPSTGSAATSITSTSALNTQLIFYGGGLNLSTVSWETSNANDHGDPFSIDFLSASIQDGYVSQSVLGMGLSLGTLARCVEIVTGSHDYVAYTNAEIVDGETPYLYGESPQIADLQNHIVDEE